jgi:ATP-binding cassette subfamily C (CFTR/MRP) protein 1
LISRAIILLSEPETQESKNYGYGLIGATFFVYVGIAISNIHYRQRFFRIITMFRGGVISLIYHHTLHIQDGIYSESAAVTLMSTDIDSMVNALQQVNEIWARSIEVVIGIALLAMQLGAIALVPVVLVILCMFGQTWVAKYIGGSRMAWNAAVQSRVATTSSMISSMKAVKMMGLQDTLQTIVQNQRIAELKVGMKFFKFMTWHNFFGKWTMMMRITGG